MIKIDKIAHFAVSFLLADLINKFLLYTFEGYEMNNIIFAAMTAFAIGFLKEIFDAIIKSQFSWKDLLADTAGILLFILVNYDYTNIQRII
jgi:VanZ family protein